MEDLKVGELWRYYDLSDLSSVDDGTFGSFVTSEVRRNMRQLIEKLVDERKDFYHDETDHAPPCGCLAHALEDFGLPLENQKSWQEYYEKKMRARTW